MLLSNFDCRPMRVNQMNALTSFNDLSVIQNIRLFFVPVGGLLAIYHSL